MNQHSTLSRNLVMAAALLCALLLQGCATIISGTKDTVEVTSNPPGAVVQLEKTGAEYTTPASFQLARRNTHTMLVKKDGYHTERVTIGRSLNPWLFGNIIFGGVIGVAVDLISGATFMPSPGEAHVELTPLRPGETTEVRDWIPPRRRKPQPQKESEVTEAADTRERRAG